jgi:hypothetical protein
MVFCFDDAVRGAALAGDVAVGLWISSSRNDLKAVNHNSQVDEFTLVIFHFGDCVTGFLE